MTSDGKPWQGAVTEYGKCLLTGKQQSPLWCKKRDVTHGGPSNLLNILNLNFEDILELRRIRFARSLLQPARITQKRKDKMQWLWQGIFSVS